MYELTKFLYSPLWHSEIMHGNFVALQMRGMSRIVDLGTLNLNEKGSGSPKWRS